MDYKPLVSVIIPVYMVENWLPICLDSLCRQSLSHIEILLIDDASPDNSGVICEKYAEMDARFKVFHHSENKGLSVARNTGIYNSTCDYLMFVDSDDFVHVDFCKKAYECALRYHADLVMFNSQRIKKNIFTRKRTLRLLHVNASNNVSSGYKTRTEAIGLLHNCVGQAVWNKLYRKELFNNTLFPKGSLAEDIGTIYKIVWNSSSIYYLNDVLYYYCQHSGSLTTIQSKKSEQDWIEMFLKQYHDLSVWGYPAELLEILLLNIAMSYCIQKRTDYSDAYYNYFSTILQDSSIIPKEVSWKKKCLFFLFRHCKSLFELLCTIYGLKRW